MDTSRKAMLADQLLNNPLLTEILEDMRTATVRAWETQPIADKRVSHWYMVSAISQLRTNIENMARSHAKD